MNSFASAMARKMFSALGLSAVRAHQTYESDRITTFRRRNVDLVIDVGANVGQYARKLRAGGYDGSIVSVEPLPDAFAQLERNLGSDPNWRGFNLAAGRESSKAKLNVSADSVCSSLLDPSDVLLDAIPTARIIETVEVDVVRLDDIDLPGRKNTALKLDVQGFEREALAGAEGLLKSVVALELELSLKATYNLGYNLDKALPEIVAHGFFIKSIGRGLSDRNSGQLMDVDVLFERNI